MKCFLSLCQQEVLGRPSITQTSLVKFSLKIDRLKGAGLSVLSLQNYSMHSSPPAEVHHEFQPFLAGGQAGQAEHAGEHAGSHCRTLLGGELYRADCNELQPVLGHSYCKASGGGPDSTPPPLYRCLPATAGLGNGDGIPRPERSSRLHAGTQLWNPGA